MPTLTPIISPIIQEAISQKDLFFEGINRYGSPLNILFPQNYSQNVECFQKIIEKYNIDAKIFYAHKPNKSPLFVREAKNSGIGIDVASVKELASALDAGVPTHLIEATGPKSEKFLKACLKENVIINVDALYELEEIIRSSRKKKQEVRILIRISNFSSLSSITEKRERFGIDASQVSDALTILSKEPSVQLLGFSFHINNDSFEERVLAIKKCLEITLLARERGFSCRVLNIGGGFQANLIDNQEELNEYLLSFKNSLRGNDQAMSFNGTKYGYTFDGKAIKGDYTFQPPYRSTPKELFLDKILSTELFEYENRSIADTLSDLNLQLWIEPGQGLLDQCGITVMKILGIKEKQSEKIIFVEGNYTNLDSDRYELFTDPIVIKKKPGTSKLDGYFISGNLCLSIDMIMNHKVFLPQPQEDDLLVFINTAPYRMDFVESHPLQNDIAQKVYYTNNHLIPEAKTYGSV